MAKLKLRGTDIKSIRSYIVEFFREDMNHRGYCKLSDFIIDEEYDEAYADIRANDAWYSARLCYEQRHGRKIIPTDFSFSQYKGGNNACN